MLKPLGNCVIAKKVEQPKGRFFAPDKQTDDRPAQYCEIVALPNLDPEKVYKPLETNIFVQLGVGMRVYVRFRGYLLNDSEELFACAVEDVLAIDVEEVAR